MQNGHISPLNSEEPVEDAQEQPTVYLPPLDPLAEWDGVEDWDTWFVRYIRAETTALPDLPVSTILSISLYAVTNSVSVTTDQNEIPLTDSQLYAVLSLTKLRKDLQEIINLSTDTKS